MSAFRVVTGLGDVMAIDADKGVMQIRGTLDADKGDTRAYIRSTSVPLICILYYVGMNQLVAHLDGVVSIARGEKRIPRGR
jgi:hypothetical protein